MVVVMAVCGKDKNDNLVVVHLIDKAVLLRYAARPLSGTVTGKPVGMASAGNGTYFQFFNELIKFLSKQMAHPVSGASHLRWPPK